MRCEGVNVWHVAAAGQRASRRWRAGRSWWGVVWALPWLLWPGPAAAEEAIEIRSVNVELVDEVLYLNAAITYRLAPSLVDALHEGVPLTFLLEIEIVRPRPYWVDDVVAHLQQRYRLEYHALTRQYLLTNVNSGSQFRFPSLEAAVSVLGTVVRLPLVDRNLLARDQDYYGRLQVLLDEEALPVPLRLLSYFSADWRLQSAWYTWQFHL